MRLTNACVHNIMSQGVIKQSMIKKILTPLEGGGIYGIYGISPSGPCRTNFQHQIQLKGNYILADPVLFELLIMSSMKCPIHKTNKKNTNLQQPTTSRDICLYCIYTVTKDRPQWLMGLYMSHDLFSLVHRQ